MRIRSSSTWLSVCVVRAAGNVRGQSAGSRGRGGLGRGHEGEQLEPRARFNRPYNSRIWMRSLGYVLVCYPLGVLDGVLGRPFDQQ